MAKRIIGLDIGAYSIKVLHLENSEVKKTHEVPYSEEALLSLKGSEWLEGDLLVTGLSGADAQVRSLDVPFSSTKKINSVLGSLLDAQLPLEIDDLVLSWFLQTEKKEPQQRILAAFAKKTSVGTYLETLEKIDVNPKILTLKAAGLYELLKIELKEPKLAALIDIGSSSTSICIGDDKKMLVARSVFKSDPASVLREVRQTFLAFDKPIEQVYLVGGLALTPNIESEFVKILGVPVKVLKPFGLSPAMAMVASYALIGQTPNEKHNRFNLRKDDFAFRSEIKFVTGHTRTFGVWALILMGLLVVNYGTRRYFLSARINDLRAEEMTLCKKVTGAAACLSTIKKTLAKDKQDRIPEMSALDIYLKVSNALPTDVKAKLTDLDIANNSVRLSGETADFESVDLLVAGLSKASCFKNVDKGRARQSTSGVSFQISMDVDCGSES
ncbi:MAG: PilN domain-containing protein [Myxococcaceae bacterium]